MPHAFQLLDAAKRTMSMAVETGGFYKMPKALAGIRALMDDLGTIINSYANEAGRDTPPRPTNVSTGAGFDSGALDNENADDAPILDE